MYIFVFSRVNTSFSKECQESEPMPRFTSKKCDWKLLLSDPIHLELLKANRQKVRQRRGCIHHGKPPSFPETLLCLHLGVPWCITSLCVADICGSLRAGVRNCIHYRDTLMKVVKLWLTRVWFGDGQFSWVKIESFLILFLSFWDMLSIAVIHIV